MTIKNLMPRIITLINDPPRLQRGFLFYFWILSEVRNKKHDRVGTSYNHFNSYLIVCCRRRRIGRGIPNSRKVRVEINAEIKQSREKQEVSELHEILYQVRSHQIKENITLKEWLRN